MSLPGWPNPAPPRVDPEPRSGGAVIVLASDLVVLVPPTRLRPELIRAIGEQWRAVTEEVRIIVLAEPLEVLDLRADEAIAALVPELRELADRLAGVAS